MPLGSAASSWHDLHDALGLALVRPQAAGRWSGRSGQVKHRSVDLAAGSIAVTAASGANPLQSWIPRSGRPRHRAGLVGGKRHLPASLPKA